MKIKLISLLILTTFLLKANKDHSILATPNPTVQELAEQTNLVLRQVGHELLLITGNDSTNLMPVQQPQEHIFLLALQEHFYYDTLPFLLHAALERFEMVSEPYYVAVKDCNSDTLILGYDVRQFLDGKVPCIGRHQYASCNYIYVNFPNRKMMHSPLTHNYIYGMLIGIFLIFGIYYWAKIGRAHRSTKMVGRGQNKEANLGNQFTSFGNSHLDLPNQLLYIYGIKSRLTFREAKLLHFFVSHSNQLLTRQAILDHVWGDEGVMVGRSLDVFVSRLRKLLKSDATLGIKSVHGVGYRLEITS